MQLGLEMHRAALERAGVKVPHFSGSEKATGSHKQLCDQMAALVEQGESGAPAWAELAGIIRGHDGPVLVSSEIFSTRMISHRYVDTVIPFLRGLGMRPHFVYFLRDQAAWINSLYVQQTRRFYTALEFDTYIEQCFGIARYDYRRMLLRLMERDDVDVTVLPFESAARSGLFAAFLDAIGLDLGAVEEPPRQNTNAGVKSVYVGRQIAEAFAQRGLRVEEHRQVFRAFQRRYEAMNWNDAPFCGFTDPSAEALRRRFEPSNDRLAQRLWQRPWSEVVPPVRGLTRQTFDLEGHLPWQHLDVRRLVWDLRRMVNRI